MDHVCTAAMIISRSAVVTLIHHLITAYTFFWRESYSDWCFSVTCYCDTLRCRRIVILCIGFYSRCIQCTCVQCIVKIL